MKIERIFKAEEFIGVDTEGNTHHVTRLTDAESDDVQFTGSGQATTILNTSKGQIPQVFPLEFELPGPKIEDAFAAFEDGIKAALEEKKNELDAHFRAQAAKPHLIVPQGEEIAKKIIEFPGRK